MTIKHIVMWKVRGDDAATRARNLTLVKTEFESLRGRVPGLLHLEVGVDESRIDIAFDIVLYTEFATRQALIEYADHPDHQRVRRNLGDVRTARHQVDYEIADDVIGTGRDRSPWPAGASAGNPPQGDSYHVQTLR